MARRLRIEIAFDPNTIRPVGRIAWDPARHSAAVEWDPAFLADPLPISPYHIKTLAGLYRTGNPAAFEGLPGVFGDSLPDGWGRLLIDRELERRGSGRTAITPVDRLAIVGTHGMGALTYRPEERTVDLAGIDLEWFADLATSMAEDASVEDLGKARAAAGGSAGARPKFVALLDVETGRVRDHRRTPERGERQVLIKHRAAADSPTAIEEEEAYARMARAAGIAMPWTMVLRSRRGDPFLAVERFDRRGAGRVHMHTAAGLLDVDFRQPSIDYANLLKLVRWTTRHAGDQDEMFRRMTFNVLTHNRDDHLKNHAFLMDPRGSWRLSPAYDISFSDGPGGEHHLAIAGEGRRPGRKHVDEVGRALGMKPAAIAALVDPICAAVADWPRHADAAGVPSRRAKQIAGYFAI
ncbi:type II toxin-antitoxin system HipA family toxin (plasmid) [Cereibacter azotoformans]|uniref:type II toxin-antitoxin system HipA family toxin n=1 Tax=Cereibacter azotoformans TaxID=43057 RepID=UPI000C6DC9F5|nr:type II toxin-antitoxin system HipA family toxin [Cereibacter azotoformans]AXQ96117.1 type II toxin-antitoxin system HipA family toxin [Cereibacter sphaeroides]UIJ32955.1 type II toxin-antitoxin system HipA family toxin [Cereibacter azotoformans]